MDIAGIRIDLNFPPKDWGFTFLLWLPALVFASWTYKFYKYRSIGVTVAKNEPSRFSFFHVFPGKVTEKEIKKLIKRESIVFAYFSSTKTKFYALLFAFVTFFILLISFLDIKDFRNI